MLSSMLRGPSAAKGIDTIAPSPLTPDDCQSVSIPQTPVGQGKMAPILGSGVRSRILPNGSGALERHVSLIREVRLRSQPAGLERLGGPQCSSWPARCGRTRLAGCSGLLWPFQAFRALQVDRQPH